MDSIPDGSFRRDVACYVWKALESGPRRCKQRLYRAFIFALVAAFSFSTSPTLNRLNSPGGTSKLSGPYRTRLIFSTWCPISSNMRRIWRFLPSISVTSYQGFSDSRIRRIFAGAVFTRCARLPLEIVGPRASPPVRSRRPGAPRSEIVKPRRSFSVPTHWVFLPLLRRRSSAHAKRLSSSPGQVRRRW